jgi:hypothetical protein
MRNVNSVALKLENKIDESVARAKIAQFRLKTARTAVELYNIIEILHEVHSDPNIIGSELKLLVFLSFCDASHFISQYLLPRSSSLITLPKSRRRSRED